MSPEKEKIRIYDLAKNLVPNDLTEKEKKNVQSIKTKRILEICKELGVVVKTASSSLEKEFVAKVLLYIDKEIPNSEKISLTTENTQASKKISRVVRRIVKEENEIEEEISTKEEEDLENSSEKTQEDILKERITSFNKKVINKIETKEMKFPPIQEKEKSIIQESQKEIIEEIQINKTEEIQEQKIEALPKKELKENFDIIKKDKIIENTKPLENVKIEKEIKKESVKEQPIGKNQPYRVAKPVNIHLSKFKKKDKAKPQKKTQQLNKFQQKGRDTLSVKEKPSIIEVNTTLTIHDLAEKLGISDTEIIRCLFMQGIMRTINQVLEKDLIIKVAKEFNCEVLWEEASTGSSDLTEKLKQLVDSHGKDESVLEKRSPVVTIMGHVDHGKTTLLDAIRKSKKDITSTESGGITQHIGAYQIKIKDHEGKSRKITFLDTPGHEAFTALRSRGAQVTDIAILVVSADDGVMPQTLEAISHARAANVPIIVAVNKIDKPDANVNRVLGQLADNNLVVEDYGGPVVCSHISAKQRINLDDLLAKITLVSDIELAEKLMADPNARAVGAVIESTLSSNKGSIATLLIQSGTLKKGDVIVAGGVFGRVRAILDDEGKEIDSAPPSTPVQILGIDGQPQAGDTFEVVKDAQTAKAQAEAHNQRENLKSGRSLERFSSMVREGEAKELPVIIKTDVQGSAEAITLELSKLNTEEVFVKIIHCASGRVTESDINLAATAGAIIVNFNSIMDYNASKMAQDNNVSVYTYNIIYQVTEAVKKALSGLLEDEKIEIKHGSAEVRDVFSVGKNKIAGCYVLDGKILNGSIVKIYRNKKELITASLSSLKRFKDNAKEVLQGFECGVIIDGFNDFEQGDIIESWGVQLKERVLS